tara:strand:- start:12406 stop:12936 length:531 start_codon:yes stop_codon:yes gene_type:complete
MDLSGNAMGLCVSHPIAMEPPPRPISPVVSTETCLSDMNEYTRGWYELADLAADAARAAASSIRRDGVRDPSVARWIQNGDDAADVVELCVQAADKAFLAYMDGNTHHARWLANEALDYADELATATACPSESMHRWIDFLRPSQQEKIEAMSMYYDVPMPLLMHCSCDLPVPPSR